MKYIVIYFSQTGKEGEEFGREMVKRSRRISAGKTNLIPPEPFLELVLPPELF